VLSIPVMDIRARFVSRVYPARGGGGGDAYCCCWLGCEVDEKGLLRVKQREHIDERDLPGRMMSMVACCVVAGVGSGSCKRGAWSRDGHPPPQHPQIGKQ
jgi:hypothetical protein